MMMLDSEIADGLSTSSFSSPISTMVLVQDSMM
ncbi:hypothetical protein LINPERPRIM_LOCUS4794 [Linum perenne]